MSTLQEQLQGKRFGLVLSAGYFGFFGHLGFVQALLEQGLTPAAWAGTSAGGLTAGFVAAGLAPARVGELMLGLSRDDFWDPDLLGLAMGALRKGPHATGLLKGDRFRGLLERHLPVKTFEECRAPLLMVAANLSRQSPLVLASGELASAIHATCAYPGMFQAVRREGHLLWDGGLVDKAPALALADSPQGLGLDALLVHFLPSHDEDAEPQGAFAYASGMASGLAALRRDHFRLQLMVLKARGLPVHVVTSQLPRLGPKQLALAPEAMRAAADNCRRALEQPPGAWLGTD